MTPRRRVIPVFVPHLGCPHRCVFCNQRVIAGAKAVPSAETVRGTIEAALKSLPDGAPFEIAFYGGSFTAVPRSLQDALLGAAAPFVSRQNASVRVSTRPDSVDGETARYLKSMGVRTVELGAQSMDDAVLALSGRGHKREDTIRAARAVREAGLELVLQMMTGLPGDTPERAARTARALIALKPDGVRIYPAVVLRGTALEAMWRSGQYAAHTVEDAVKVCAELYEMFEKPASPSSGWGCSPRRLSPTRRRGVPPRAGELVLSRVLFKRAVDRARGEVSDARGASPSACTRRACPPWSGSTGATSARWRRRSPAASPSPRRTRRGRATCSYSPSSGERADAAGGKNPSVSCFSGGQSCQNARKRI